MSHRLTTIALCIVWGLVILAADGGRHAVVASHESNLQNVGKTDEASGEKPSAEPPRPDGAGEAAEQPAEKPTSVEPSPDNAKKDGASTTRQDDQKAGSTPPLEKATPAEDATKTKPQAQSPEKSEGPADKPSDKPAESGVSGLEPPEKPGSAEKSEAGAGPAKDEAFPGLPARKPPKPIVRKRDPAKRSRGNKPSRPGTDRERHLCRALQACRDAFVRCKSKIKHPDQSKEWSIAKEECGAHYKACVEKDFKSGEWFFTRWFYFQELDCR